MIYLDTYGSTYGAGWARENSFLARSPAGGFCYGFVTRNSTTGGYQTPPGWTGSTIRGPGLGSQYRVMANGPDVTPFVSWTGQALHTFDTNNPGNLIEALRQNFAANDPGRNVCEGGDADGGYWLQDFRDDFKGNLQSNWAVTATGGATASEGAGGLAVSFPAGQQSSVTLSARGGNQQPQAIGGYFLGNANEVGTLAAGGFSYFDLGSEGIPSGATFQLALTFPRNSSRYLGLRIADGQLQAIEHDSVNPSTPVSVIASATYDPTKMRWIMWRRHVTLAVGGP